MPGLYLPPRFQAKENQAVQNLLENFPLATLISIHQEQSFISHLPLVKEHREGKDFLIGHLARANPHSLILKDSPQVKVLFHGPQAYINPLWYKENDVPTWNYAVVHVEGQCRLLETHEEILTCLQKLTAHMNTQQEPWEFWLPPDLDSPQALRSAIVGFEILVERMDAKFKLSQNRSEEDRQSVVQNLLRQNNDQAHHIAALMEDKA